MAPIPHGSPIATRPPTTTPGPTPTRTLDQLCRDLNAYWGKDWRLVVDTLETLHAKRERCGGDDPYLKLYPAYYNYGVWLEWRGDIRGAITAYRNALLVQPAGREAAIALRKHNALTPPAPSTCPVQQVGAAHARLPIYTPTSRSGYARLENGQLVIGSEPFRVRGVNYYPSRGPWRRFLTETDLATVAQELDLIREAGLNTIRVFVWYEALFDCPGNGAVPRAEGFARLDGVIRLAAARGLKVLLTLNDLPDLLVRPLYTFPEVPDAQTEFIVRRYRDEPAILAWDLRNEGDIDWIRGYASSRAVLGWLRALSARVRALDPNHLITAGWNEHSQLTADAVDFLSFHHWRSVENLRERIAVLRTQSDKPILLQEIGYSTYAQTDSAEASQAERLGAALAAAEDTGLLGWMAWTAFDFPTSATCIPPACPSRDSAEHHFGLWRKDYSPKPAVETIRALTGR